MKREKECADSENQSKQEHSIPDLVAFYKQYNANKKLKADVPEWNSRGSTAEKSSVSFETSEEKTSTRESTHNKATNPNPETYNATVSELKSAVEELVKYKRKVKIAKAQVLQLQERLVELGNELCEDSGLDRFTLR